MPQPHFDTYYRYDDLTRLLHEYAGEYPHLVRLASIGKSFEGRELWLATVTAFASGEDREKPALWVDGNIHAGEVAPSMACLYLLHHLVTNYGADPDVTRCLETRAFYICPRVNPDGAELALADRPRFIRSSTRPYPYDEEPLEGLSMEDVDGDGRILLMRLPDPNGPWKICPEEPRLLVRRDPAETGGTYYRVLPEGLIKDYDGVTLQMRQDKEGLDLNRNFPVNWRQEHEQQGAGPYPASEPETRALVQFCVEHPNVTGGIAFHTFGGVLLRPFDDRSDDEFPPEDLWTYQKIGQKGTDLTGYPAISIYHDFRFSPKEITSGAFDTWLYDYMGRYAWTVEIWSLQRHAGVEVTKEFEWFREHPLEDDLKLLHWGDETLGKAGYVDWYPFDHPQLGRVEMGGWDDFRVWANPPAAFLEKEIAPFAGWLVWYLLISPRLELYEASAKPLGDGAYRVRLVVQNTGWLPTYLTKKALEKKLVRGVVAEIELPAGATLESGKAREELPQLEGRSLKPPVPSVFEAGDPTVDRAKVEWVVRAPAGGTVKLVARHERAGVVRGEVTL